MELVDLSQVDTSNLVEITLDNPHYNNSIPMELGFEWPEHRVLIIQAIKTAVRLNLKISMCSRNKEANDFIHAYFNEYACIDYLKEHPEEMKVLYPWLIERNQ